MEQEEPKVSVIIPVYNTAAYVRQAIDSIRNQTLQELEIIVVNDGSTDDSGEILRELANADPRMRVYEQENQGLSVTRNVGISHAIGHYIYFMDSDDLLEADALELCYAKCEAEALDFVFFDAKNFGDEKTSANLFNYKRTEHLREGVYTGIEMLNVQIGLFQYTSSVCLNFIRREYLTHFSLHFFPGILHEDQLFSALLYLQASKISFIRRSFFHRRMRKDSIMTRCFAWRNMEGYLTVANQLLQYGKNESPAVSHTIRRLMTQMLNAAMWQAHVMSLPDRIKTIVRFRNDNLMAFVKKEALTALLFRKYKPAGQKKSWFKAILLLAIVAFIADYAYQYISFQAYNQTPLAIATPEGSNQPYHPSVVYIPQGWNGYTYWMAETPYPLGKNGEWSGLAPYRARWENPCIHASNDGIHWEVPQGASNPIDDLNEDEISQLDFFSDTHLALNGDTLECWYRISRKKKGETYILRKYSVDGRQWSERETIIDLQDSSVVNNGPGSMILSPAVRKTPNGYIMWYVDRVKTPRQICRSTSADGWQWSKKEVCQLENQQTVPWHIDVQLIDSTYYMVVYDFNNLALWESKDGLLFQKRKTLLSPARKVGSFYAYGLYRSALIKDDHEYKLYFSAYEKGTSIGLMRGPSADSLTIYPVAGKRISAWKFPFTYLRLKKQSFASLFK